MIILTCGISITLSETSPSTGILKRFPVFLSRPIKMLLLVHRTTIPFGFGTPAQTWSQRSSRGTREPSSRYASSTMARLFSLLVMIKASRCGTSIRRSLKAHSWAIITGSIVLKSTEICPWFVQAGRTRNCWFGMLKKRNRFKDTTVLREQSPAQISIQLTSVCLLAQTTRLSACLTSEQRKSCSTTRHTMPLSIPSLFILRGRIWYQFLLTAKSK